MALKSKTLFVLGAGASKEIGLPTGYELKHRLAKRLDIRFLDGYQQSSGDKRITEALESVVRTPEGREGNINPYLAKAWLMVSALPQAISIDNYIDALEDMDVALLGKLAITREILESEKNSKIFFNEGSLKFETAEHYNLPNMLRSVEATNYHGLFQLLSEGFRKSNCESMFENASFISFNYDRSVEWYLKNAILNFFGVDVAEAELICESMKIIHPYGTVGALPLVRPVPSAVPYGGSQRDDYVKIANGIRTFTEQIEDDKLSDEIELQVTSAKHIVFLGFGFHDINMQTLATQKNTVLRHVFGTALGVSNSDVEAIKSTILQSFASGSVNEVLRGTQRIDLGNLDCNTVFKEYARSLRA